MADLNALIAQGYQFQPAPDPFAQYAKMQQLDVGEQTNQLNRMKMQEYQRGMEEINAMRKLDPSSATYLQDITRINPEKGFAFAKSEQERKNLVSTGEHLNAQTKGLTIKALGDTFDNFTKLNPPTTASTSPKGVTAYITNLYSDPLLGAVAAKQMPLEQALQVNLEAAAKDPKAWATAHLGLTGDKLFESMKGTRQNVSMGGTSQGQTIDAYGNVVPGSTVNTLMTMTPGEKSTAATAASRLTFDQQKFAWDKANPGHELIQNADGEYYAVDKRTKAMTPLMVGGSAAPAAAAPMGGGQGARGVVGVTDGGRAAPAAGVPFVGKSAGLTESQSNAALFGSGMAQAQNVLTKASSKGVDTAPVTTSVVQGIVKYVPFGVGDKLVQDVMSVAQQDPTKLFGPDVEQQKVGQAQLAFAIAYLRKTSGAAFGPSELVNTMNEFFPSIGEDKSMITQKAKARERVVQGMKLAAGSQGGKFIKQYEEETGGVAPSANDPLGLRK